jgi:hypothetical protein
MQPLAEAVSGNTMFDGGGNPGAATTPQQLADKKSVIARLYEIEQKRRRLPRRRDRRQLRAGRPAVRQTALPQGKISSAGWAQSTSSCTE